MTGWMLGLAAAGIAVPLALEILHRWRSTRRIEHPLPDPDWARAAQRLGLRLLPGPAPSWAILEGRIREFAVHVESRSGDPAEAGDEAVFAVSLPGAPPGFALHPHPPGDAATGRASPADALYTGDPAFTAEAKLHGDEAQSLALLDAPTRALLRERLLDVGGRVEAGRLILHVRYGSAGERTIRETLDALVTVAEALRRSDHDVPTALRKLALSDPVEGVRRRGLEVLIRDHPDRGETLDACRRLAENVEEVAWTRLVAARGLGRDGVSALERLARSPEMETKTRMAALGDLGTLIPAAARVKLALELIEDPAPQVRAAALRALGELEHVGAFERVLRCASDADVETAAAAAEALGRFADPRAEPQLLALLGRPHDLLRIAALKALARVGTLAASGPLTQLATGGLATVSPRVWAAAEEALKAIQERVGAAAGGRLSLAVVGDDRGGLSLARGEGDLSIAVARAADELPAAAEASSPDRRAPEGGPATTTGETAC